jgi:amino acid permease
MKFENPFETGHIKNYILAYLSALVIVILFFIASSLFNDIKKHPKKKFNTTIEKKEKTPKQKTKDTKTSLKLLEKVY